VSCRILLKGERLGKSDGFSGYDWMVDSILDYGKIMATHEIKKYLEEKQAVNYTQNYPPQQTKEE
jgi:hypothetical protein